MLDIVFYVWDVRGYGKSSGSRGYSLFFARLVRDVDEFVRFVVSDS